MPKLLSDEYDRRSRLVLLAYEVLRDIKMPADEGTDVEILSLLSFAFLEKASQSPQLKAAAPEGRRGNPSSMFSIPDRRTSALRRDH
jgi:hypothetical protein